MIYIDKENLEIIMLKKHMEDRSSTNEKEIETMKGNLKKAIGKLSENQRKVLDMYFYEGKKEIEIAEIMEMHRPNINRLKRSAVDKLKILLVV